MEEVRKAARKALEELERRVDVEDSHKSMKDLERLCGWPIPYVGGFKNRMEYYEGRYLWGSKYWGIKGYTLELMKAMMGLFSTQKAHALPLRKLFL
ncbi:unnamed protein product [Citrullus colocynthis]|uniref:Uncharacterized protein n=1 Tax=Citrullus colocynthis TaxID=252529 RepID=A0ABP0XMT3_9ROSI